MCPYCKVELNHYNGGGINEPEYDYCPKCLRAFDEEGKELKTI